MPPSSPSVAANPASTLPPKPEPEWLVLLNQYRSANDLRPVAEDAQLSAGDLKHARYLVKNQIGFMAGADMHDENKTNQFYTDSGYWAGHSGNVMLATRELSQSEAMERWMGAPFHGLAMLAPDLRNSGFGLCCEAGRCAAVLSTGHMSDLYRVRKTRVVDQFDYDSDAPEKQDQAILETPVRWPAPGASISDDSFDGREWPNPLSACPGYQAPTGPVIFASFGRDFIADPRPESLICNGAPVEHCVITAENYTSRDPSQLSHARETLKYFAAVLVIPREPLDPGTTCEVSLMVQGVETKWSFSVRQEPGQAAGGGAPR